VGTKPIEPLLDRRLHLGKAGRGMSRDPVAQVADDRLTRMGEVRKTVLGIHDIDSFMLRPPPTIVLAPGAV